MTGVNNSHECSFLFVLGGKNPEVYTVEKIAKRYDLEEKKAGLSLII